MLWAILFAPVTFGEPGPSYPRILILKIEIMKKYLLQLLALGILGTAYAQEEKTDTTRINIGDLKVIIIDGDPDSSAASALNEIEPPEDPTEELTHWAGIDLGVNMLMDAGGNYEFEGDNEWLNLNYPRSLSVDINLAEFKIKLAKQYVGIVTGFGLGYSNYGFRDSVVISSNSDTTLAGYSSDIKYRVNKLRTTHFRVPVLLEFNTSEDPKKTFHIAFGAVGGWRIGTITKQRYDVDGKDVKQKVRGDFNVNTFEVDATMRIGYRSFTLFANYALTPLFKDGKGPEVYPLTVGLALTNW